MATVQQKLKRSRYHLAFTEYCLGYPDARPIDYHYIPPIENRHIWDQVIDMCLKLFVNNSENQDKLEKLNLLLERCGGFECIIHENFIAVVPKLNVEGHEETDRKAEIIKNAFEAGKDLIRTTQFPVELIKISNPFMDEWIRDGIPITELDTPTKVLLRQRQYLFFLPFDHNPNQTPIPIYSIIFRKLGFLNGFGGLPIKYNREAFNYMKAIFGRFGPVIFYSTDPKNDYVTYAENLAKSFYSLTDKAEIDVQTIFVASLFFHEEIHQHINPVVFALQKGTTHCWLTEAIAQFYQYEHLAKKLAIEDPPVPLRTWANVHTYPESVLNNLEGLTPDDLVNELVDLENGGLKLRFSSVLLQAIIQAMGITDYSTGIVKIMTVLQHLGLVTQSPEERLENPRELYNYILKFFNIQHDAVVEEFTKLLDFDKVRQLAKQEIQRRELSRANAEG